MDDFKLSTLEQRLLEHLEQELSLAPGSARQNPRVAQALREALEAAELTDQERAALESPKKGEKDRGMADRLVAARLEGALQKSMTVLAAQDKLATDRTVRVAVWDSSGSPIFAPSKSGAPAAAAAGRTLLLVDDVAPGAASRSERNSDWAWGEHFANDDPVPLEIDREQIDGIKKKLTQLAVEVTGDSGLLWGENSREGELAIGELLGGKYRILREIGKGGFGAVYEARDEILGNKVAVKYLNARAAPTKEDHEALKEEARRVTKLNHPNIVDWKVFDEREDGSYYFVMELLEGVDLEKLLEDEGTLSPERTARILLQVVDALRTAHHLSPTESILHLDLKPKNVFIVQDKTTGEERVKVIDFGIGQYVGGGDDELAAPEPVQGEIADELRDAGVAPPTLIPGGRVSIGTMKLEGKHGVEMCTACTPEYASPEQCVHILPKGEIPLSLDGRSDLYSVGIMGYEMLTGKLPYDTPESYLDWFLIHRKTPPRKLKIGRGRVARELTHFLERCLKKDRDDRWEDANEAFEALEAIVHPPAWKQVLKVTVPLLVVGLLLAYLFWPEPSSMRFDLYRGEASAASPDQSEETLVSGDSLYLGPESREMVLRIAGLPEDTEVALLRLTEDPLPGSPALPGWQVTPVEDSIDRVRLVAPALDGRYQKSVCLGVESVSGEELFSNPFTLTYLHEGSWDLDSIGIEGLGSRAVEPREQSLTITVRGQETDVARVAVDVAGVPRTAVKSTSENEFRVPLTDFDLGEGTVPFKVTAIDRAGGAKTREVPFSVVRGPLSFRAELNATRAKAQDLYYVYESTRPRLTVTLNRPADLTWRVVSKGEVLRGGELSGNATYQVELADLASWQDGEAYVGSIEIEARETSYVLHADASRGVAADAVHFESSKDAPGVLLSLVSTRGRRDLEDGEPEFIRDPKPTLRIVRQNDIPVEVEVAVSRAQAEDIVGSFEPRRLLGPRASGEKLDFPLQLPEDGLYRIAVDLYRYDPETESRSGAPVAEHDHPLVLDTNAPTLSLTGDPGVPALFHPGSTAPLSIQVLASDAPLGAGAPENRVTVSWKLVRPAGSAPWPTSPWDTIREIGIDGPRSLVLDRPGSANAPGGHDGSYRLVVTGTDRAGNPAPEASLPFEVALTGPALEIVRPDLDVEWVSEDGNWPLRVRARDRNGTAAISGTIAVAGRNLDPIRVDFEKTTADTDQGSVWEASAVFSHEWSEAEVVVRITGKDAREVPSSPASRQVRLPRILRYTPPRVEVVSPEGDLRAERMRYVAGNDSLHYIFGGRLDQVENALFRKTTLGAYNRGTVAKSWNIEYKTGAIAGFYLDENEVSCAQFLQFLEAPDGYRNPDHWLGGKIPPESRRKELEARIRATPDLPVTGVDWSEASAYAGWVGKRLPSFVEWEYAFRGGVEYRPYPSYAGGVTGEEEIEINSGTAAREGPWPAGTGQDVSIHGIRDLAGNVAEWTSTPCVFDTEGGSDGLSPVSHARAFRRELLAPTLFPGWQRCPQYWIAGGTYRTERFDFSQARQGRRNRRRADVGFRCAVSAQVVLDSLETQGKQKRTFRAVKR